MNIVSNVNLGVAFLGGLLTFLAPCVLPILPAYIAYLSGVDVVSRDQKKAPIWRGKIFLNSLFFVLGFLVVFVFLGIAASTIGSVLLYYRTAFRFMGGAIFIVLGLHLTEVFQIPLLAKSVKLQVSNRVTRFHYLNSFVIGLAFGFSWTPCIGPILGIILFWAGHEATFWKGFFLLLSFGLGLGLPFLILSIFTQQLMNWFRRLGKGLRYLQIIAGIVIIILGLLLLTNNIAVVSGLLSRFGSLELLLNLS